MSLLRQVVVLGEEVTESPTHLGAELGVAGPQLVLPVQGRGGGEGVHLNRE